jgi:hypothetical protein
MQLADGVMEVMWCTDAKVVVKSIIEHGVFHYEFLRSPPSNIADGSISAKAAIPRTTSQGQSDA